MTKAIGTVHILDNNKSTQHGAHGCTGKGQKTLCAYSANTVANIRLQLA